LRRPRVAPIDRGELDLQKPIKTYLPGYTGPAGGTVTLHQLLNHTSGIDNIDKVKSAAEALRNGLPVYQTPYTSDQLLAKFCTGPLVHPPGTAFDYNNADYIIVKRPAQIMGAQGQLYHVMAPDITIVILSNVGNTDLDEFVAAHRPVTRERTLLPSRSRVGQR